MKGTFQKRGRQCDVTVSQTHLRCSLKNHLGPNVQMEIDLKDILAVQTQPQDSLVVHYAAYKKDETLSWERLVLSGHTELCQELNTVFSLAMAERQRPKQFLVIINPNAGKKAGGRIFHKKVAPLFRACGISFKIYVTSGPSDAHNAFQDVDFHTLDGVIAVGGDGILTEVMTAIVLRQQQILGGNPDDPDLQLPTFPFPVGIIPTGGGNWAAKFLHGTADVMTSALKIVLAQTRPINLGSLHQGSQLIGVCHLLASFGLMGDMMRSCEKYRWMGAMRYKVIPVRTLFQRRLIEAVVEYMKEGSDQWLSTKGSYYIIDTNICELADKDAKLVPVFHDTAMTLHLTSACNLGDHMKQLSKVADFTAGAFNYEFIHVERVIKYRVRLPALEGDNADNPAAVYYMNFDGEAIAINKPVFQISLHRGVLQVFGDCRH